MGASRGPWLPWIPFFFGDIWDPSGTEPSQELWDAWILIRNVDPHGQLGEFSLVLGLLGSRFPDFLFPLGATGMQQLRF